MGKSLENGNYLLLPSYPVAFQTIEYQVHLIAIIKWNLWDEMCVPIFFIRKAVQV